MSEHTSISNIIRALDFAARKHRDQRRKDADSSPYINHIVAVASVLAVEAGITDEETLVAAVLHDTVEDTETTFDELERGFGAAVASLVGELTDDKSLPRKDRKRMQIDHSPGASPRAKCLKIADKVCNIRDVAAAPPVSWSLERRREYLTWAEEVVDGCRGVETRLDAIFDDALDRGKRALVGTQ